MTSNAARVRNEGFGGKVFGEDLLETVLKTLDANVILIANVLDILHDPGLTEHLRWLHSVKRNTAFIHIEGTLRCCEIDLKRLYRTLDESNDARILESRYPLPRINMAEAKNLSYERVPVTYEGRARLLVEVSRYHVEKAFEFEHGVQAKYKSEQAKQRILNSWFRLQSRINRLLSLDTNDRLEVSSANFDRIDRAAQDLLDLYDDWKRVNYRHPDDDPVGQQMFRQLTRMSKLHDKMRASLPGVRQSQTPHRREQHRAARRDSNSDTAGRPPDEQEDSISESPPRAQRPSAWRQERNPGQRSEFVNDTRSGRRRSAPEIQSDDMEKKSRYHEYDDPKEYKRHTNHRRSRESSWRTLSHILGNLFDALVCLS